MNVLEQLSKAGVNAVFHYIPLHSSAAGQQYGRSVGNLSQTNKASDCLLRLPLWVGMTPAEIAQVRAAVCDAIVHALRRPPTSGKQL